MDEPRPIVPGTLELYVLGALSKEEGRYIRERAEAEPELKEAIHRLEQQLESLAWKGRVEPPAHLRARVLERIAASSQMPSLLLGATARDFAPWLAELAAPRAEDLDNMHVVALSCSQNVPTAVVWVKTHVEEEVHTDVLESFLILEGTCEVLMQGRSFPLGAGDVMNIPLHTPHSVRVTSLTPCKAIVQRVAVAA